MTIDINQLEFKFNILLILFAVRFTTFWHRHRVMTHFWPPAVPQDYKSDTLPLDYRATLDG